MLKKMIVLLVFSFPFSVTSSLANLTDFEVFDDKGFQRISAKYYYTENHYVNIESTKESDLLDYQKLIPHQIHEGYPPLDRSDYFFNNYNLNRQKESIRYHLYRFSSQGKLLGFIHLGRMKTFGVKHEKGWSEFDPQDQKEILQKWTHLGIIKQKKINADYSQSNLERIEGRGLCQIQAIVDPNIGQDEKIAVMKGAVQLVSRLRGEGARLLPEKKANSYSEERTLPYQIIGLFHPADPILKIFGEGGFTIDNDPYFYDFYQKKRVMVTHPLVSDLAEEWKNLNVDQALAMKSPSSYYSFAYGLPEWRLKGMNGFF